MSARQQTRSAPGATHPGDGRVAQQQRPGTAVARAHRRPRVLMITEGTWPYAVGGVSSWCQLLLGGLPQFRFDVLPLVPGDKRRRTLFDLPPNVRLLPPIELWTERAPVQGGFRRRGRRTSLAAELAMGLLGWDSDLEALADVLVWCRRNPDHVRPAFRAAGAWDEFLETTAAILDRSGGPAGTPPELDVLEASRLYQTLYWVARTAATPTPPADVVHITAAGWATIPAVTHRAQQSTPVLLTEHGLYVREAYLGAIQRELGPSSRWTATRLARGLTRLAYSVADVISPVTQSHAGWEESFGVHPDRIRTIVNGVVPPPEPPPAPRTETVVSVGRIDPLKDVATMLRVAKVVTERLPDARFLHYGPVSAGQEDYSAACHALHRHLQLGERFRFMGVTRDPHGVLREADVVIMTSISEGQPMAVLEAMAQARPVVSTAVGGVADTLRGCGLMAPPGDVAALAAAVATLLTDHQLAERLGERGRARLLRRYQREECVRNYHDLLMELAGEGIAARLEDASWVA